MQKLKVKQLDGVVSPSASDDWSSLTDTLATAAATDARISEAVSNAVGGTLQSVTGGSAESGKYVSAVIKEGTAVKVAKTALPVTGVNTAGTGTTTKAIVSLALSSGKVVATEKNIAFPNPPVLTLDSVDFTPRNHPHQVALCRKCRGCLRQWPDAAAHRLHPLRQQTHLQRPLPLRQRRHRQHPLSHRRLNSD